jgi:hypothetical protein
MQPAVSKADIFEPFSTTNLNPFVQLYGLPATRSAVTIDKGQFAIHLQTEFANNFTESTSNSSAIAIDGETHKATLSLRYGLTDRLDATLDIPYIRHESGSLDGFIENWHDWFGLPNSGREDISQDQLAYVYQLNGTDIINIRSSKSGPGDVRLSLGYKLKETDDRIWTMRGGIKLPTGDPDKLTGTDSTDVYTSLHLTDRKVFDSEKLQFHGNLGVLAIGDSELPHTEDWVVFGSSALAWQVRGNIALKAQFDFHTPFYDSDLKELGDFSGQLVLGGTLKLTNKILLDLSISEDILTDTAPDVVFQIGISSVF